MNFIPARERAFFQRVSVGHPWDESAAGGPVGRMEGHQVWGKLCRITGENMWNDAKHSENQRQLGLFWNAAWVLRTGPKKNILRLIVKQNLYDMELVNREPWQIYAI